MFETGELTYKFYRLMGLQVRVKTSLDGVSLAEEGSLITLS